MPATDDLVRGLQSLYDARPEYEQAEQFFDGVIPEWYANESVRDAIRRKQQHLDLDLCFRLARTPVTMLSNRIRISNVSVPADNATPGSSGGQAARTDEEATTKLQELWEANDMGIWERELTRKTLEYGDAYLFVWETDNDDEYGDDTQEDDEVTDVQVTMTFNSPLEVRALYDRDNPRRVEFVIKSWDEEDPRVVVEPGTPPGQRPKRLRAELYYRDRVERWQTTIGTKVEQMKVEPSSWEPYTGDEEAVAPVEDNPYREIPIFHFRNGLLYGRPRHKDAYSAQLAINKLLTTQLVTVEDQGFPARYGLVDPAAALDENNDDPDWDDEGNAGNTTGRNAQLNSSRLRHGPGTFTQLTGLKDVKQLDAADPDVFTKPVELYTALMAQVTNTPLYAFKPGGEQPSGKARQIADAPLEADREDTQAHLRSAYAAALKFALKILGVEVPKVSVDFAPSVMATDKEDWEVVNLMQDAGVPRPEALMATGRFSREDVDAWEEESKAKEQEEFARQADQFKMLNNAVGGTSDGSSGPKPVAKPVPPKVQ